MFRVEVAGFYLCENAISSSHVPNWTPVIYKMPVLMWFGFWVLWRERWGKMGERKCPFSNVRATNQVCNKNMIWLNFYFCSSFQNSSQWGKCEISVCLMLLSILLLLKHLCFQDQSNWLRRPAVTQSDKDLGWLQSEIIWHLSCNLKIILFSSGEEPLPILLLLNPNRIEPNSAEMNRIMPSR